jgi:glycosyltransferase involved in cell wall biosynthesis
MFTEGALCRRCERGFYPSAVVHRCFPNRRQAAGYATSLWLHRFPFRLNDAVRMFVSPSRFVRERLLEWGIPEERTVVVPNFVEPGSEDPIPGSFGMFLGRISPEKGLHVLIRALGLAGDPPFRIVGDGPARPEAETLARDVGLANTRFLGRVDVEEVKRLLHESRYLVMPSVWEETFGLSAVEAMAHGKPVLVSAIGALPELVREDVGLTCAPGDSGDLAEKIRFLERDDAFCREAGARGLERFRAEYSPQVHLARLEAVYRSCLERPDRRGPGTAPDAPPSG